MATLATPRAEAVVERLTVAAYEQQASAAACRVHLLAGDDEGRAHHVLPVRLPALADADAADGRVREVAVSE